ncbi:MAG TPA: 4,5-dihydroxyphthalate decarboxylase [Xanthobacteraceae bacterium]
MSKLPLTLAISHYDHVTELVTGRVPVEGVELTALNLQIEEIFFRQFNYRDFDVSEVSMGKYCSLVSQGNAPLVAIPVFPSRVPRHSSVYIRRDGPVKKPEDLAGKRIGIPEWAQTASVYSRGFIQHQYGIDLKSIHWIQAGVDQPGRLEKVKLKLPDGIRYESRPDKSLGGMLISGEIDAALSAHPPLCFDQGHPNVGRLFEDYLDIEMKYVKETGIYPIMHAVAFRREIVEKHPWVAANLFKAFDEARRISVERALACTSSALPLPWGYEFAKRMQAVVGNDLMPYGVEANRTTLDAFLQYAFEQGVCHRRLQPEELFPPQVQKSFRV